MGGAIFASSEPGMMQEFGVGHISAKWAFALYLVGYGVGPLLFSPISEVPKIGRNPPYIITMAIFVVLCVPTAVVTNYPGLLVLRFLQGFFGSPCLATGGATLQDMFALPKLPYAMTFWAWSMTCGPALAPIISGYSVSAEGWRWSLWEILWAAGPVFMIMLIFLPETNSQTILCRRAKGLRKILATDSLTSHGEMMQRSMHWKHMAWEALVKPAELVCMDPVILYADIYSSLCYAIFYSFFESFPFVYSDIYGFSPGEQGLAFLSVTVGTLVAGIWYAVSRAGVGGVGMVTLRIRYRTIYG
ncbi:hypothetical protein D0868_16623 [Hortaea werneckii]|uniref:Major facilitator superfamily (MFS) profile domain-containing protein n=1 Tax=Hortaea werneckii TaxID=91943 RepID=A0A3M6WG55_HORWE|nr:hypothetical protein D0868_16623 [Hortaea werneckii]